MNENHENLWEIGNKLKQYLDTKEYTEILLLDLLRTGDLSQEDYTRMIKDSEQAYKQFLIDLRKEKEDR